jgi:anti-anti-sigma factor
MITRSPESDEEIEVFALPEDVDADNSSVVGSGLANAIGIRARYVVLDLTRTRYLDSSAIDMVFKLNERLRVSRRRLRLVLPAGSPLQRLLEVTFLSSVIDVDDSVPAAIAAVRAEPPQRAAAD